ncbi:putative FBD-associated F-box protein At1g05080 [Eutrema salsugineum]|nr:putative FBD-associated F-box protein At1g05080 [Eutrema salsugineum]
MLSATTEAQKVEISQRIQETICEDRISALPDDLLVRILLFIPTKDVAATMILSKRWRIIWTMVPRLEFKDIETSTNGEHEISVWGFLEKFLRLHKAPSLESLRIQLGQNCPTDVDVTKWVSNAVDGNVRKLLFDLRWSAKPVSMPNSLYTCKTLIELELSNKILLDVPSSVCLPSVTTLYLWKVLYKDEASFVKLLSSCPVLKNLDVIRCSEDDDNVKRCTVKVPSLKKFSYFSNRSSSLGNDVADDIAGSVVLDCPALKHLCLFDTSRDSYCIGNMPYIVEANITIFGSPNNNFLRYLSAATTLYLELNHRMAVMCKPDNFSQLVDLLIRPDDTDWLEQLMLLLKNNPKLKSLRISSDFKNVPQKWNKPDHVPECLASHLELFEISYKGKKEEQEFVAYILANTKYLKEAKIFLDSKNGNKQKKMREELNSMFKVSPSCRLVIINEQDRFMSFFNTP